MCEDIDFGMDDDIVNDNDVCEEITMVQECEFEGLPDISEEGDTETEEVDTLESLDEPEVWMNREEIEEAIDNENDCERLRNLRDALESGRLGVEGVEGTDEANSPKMLIKRR